jgi:hypothetical protein
LASVTGCFSAAGLFLSSSSTLLQSITQSVLVSRSLALTVREGLTPLMSFFVPSAQFRIEGPLVVYSTEHTTFRLQGLVTLMTAYALRSPVSCCFKPTALLGFSPSKLDRLPGIQPFPSGWTHLPFHPLLFPELPRSEERGLRTGPSRLRFLGFVPDRGTDHRRRV